MKFNHTVCKVCGHAKFDENDINAYQITEGKLESVDLDGQQPWCGIICVCVLTAASIFTIPYLEHLMKVSELELLLSCYPEEAELPQQFIVMDLATANAIIEMDNVGYSEGLGPDDAGECDAWSRLVERAEKVTGRKAAGSIQ